MTMSQAIKEAFGESGGALSKEAIKQSVESRYPGKWQPTTLTAHLYACAINNPKAYVHHPHSERFLYKHADGMFELYEEKAHGPNLWAPNEAEDVSEEAEQAIEASISLERDIEDQLVHQLDALEEGLTFVGRQVKCDVGRVDIVGRGADGATVVVELKSGRRRTRPSGKSPATWDGTGITRAPEPFAASLWPRIFLRGCSMRPGRCRT